MFGDELWLEAAIAISGNLDGQGAKIALEGLGAAAVTRIAVRVGNRFMLAVAQVLCQFGLQGSFNNGFGELL